MKDIRFAKFVVFVNGVGLPALKTILAEILCRRMSDVILLLHPFRKAVPVCHKDDLHFST